MNEPRCVAVTIELTHADDSPFGGTYRAHTATVHVECAQAAWVLTPFHEHEAMVLNSGEAWAPTDAIGECHGCDRDLTDVADPMGVLA